jgi:predicted O-methyltransferase YrrM
MSSSWPLTRVHLARNSVRSWFGERLNAIRLSNVPRRETSFGALIRLDDLDPRHILDPLPFQQEWQLVERDVRTLIQMGGSLHHSSNPGDKRALYQFVRHLRPGNVLEIGTAYGISALYIGLAMRRNALECGGEAGRLTTVDIVGIDSPVRSLGPNRSPRAMISNAGVADLIEFVTGDAPTFLEKTDRRFDFIYIDGSTAAAAVYRCLQSLPRVLGNEAVVLMHTYYPNGRPLWPGEPAISGPWRALLRLESEGTGITARHLGELPWPTKRGTRITSLALIGRAPRAAGVATSQRRANEETCSESSAA